IEVFMEESQRFGRRQPLSDAVDRRRPQVTDRRARARSRGRLVQEDHEQPHFEQFRPPAVQVRDALLDRLIRHRLRAGAGPEGWNIAFNDVFVDAPMLIEHPEYCLQAVNDRGALRVPQSFVVDSPELVDNADVARFRQERRIVDKVPKRDEAVDAAGIFVVAKNALDAQHDTTSTSNGSCFPGSYRRRVFDEAIRIRSMSGSRRVAHSANPYRPTNINRPAKNE